MQSASNGGQNPDLVRFSRRAYDPPDIEAQVRSFVSASAQDWPASDTLSSMDELDITREQAEQMHNRVGEMLRYLVALRRRLDERHFPQNDRFRQRVEWAHDAVHGLWVTLHYMSCPGSVGESQRRGQ